MSQKIKEQRERNDADEDLERSERDIFWWPMKVILSRDAGKKGDNRVDTKQAQTRMLDTFFVTFLP